MTIESMFHACPHHRTRRSNRAIGWLALASLLGGCALAPGMHYGAQAPSNGDPDTSATFHGVRVTLRSVSPQVAAQSAKERNQLVRLPSELTEVKRTAYHLGLYDVITVAVWEHPELTMPLGEYRADLASGSLKITGGRAG